RTATSGRLSGGRRRRGRIGKGKSVEVKSNGGWDPLRVSAAAAGGGGGVGTVVDQTLNLSLSPLANGHSALWWRCQTQTRHSSLHLLLFELHSQDASDQQDAHSFGNSPEQWLWWRRW